LSKLKQSKEEQEYRRAVKELIQIPGVGKSIADDLWNIDVKSIADLAGRDPLALYDESNNYAGVVQDKCLIYVFRCAVYYAETAPEAREPDKLKWWNWKGERKMISYEKYPRLVCGAVCNCYSHIAAYTQRQ
jgi:hypothetical protein